VKHILEEIGGTISVTSQLGVGTILHVICHELNRSSQFLNCAEVRPRAKQV